MPAGRRPTDPGGSDRIAAAARERRNRLGHCSALPHRPASGGPRAAKGMAALVPSHLAGPALAFRDTLWSTCAWPARSRRAAADPSAFLKRACSARPAWCRRAGGGRAHRYRPGAYAHGDHQGNRGAVVHFIPGCRCAALIESVLRSPRAAAVGEDRTSFRSTRSSAPSTGKRTSSAISLRRSVASTTRRKSST